MLVDIVVQLSCNSSAFLFLRRDQLSSKAGQRFFGQFPFRDVQARTDVAGKGAISVEPWHADVEDPTKSSVMPAKPVLHLE